MDYMEAVMNPSFWPQDVIIRRWQFKSKDINSVLK
jgi:hypothetical protein